MEVSKEAINRRFIKCINDLIEAREGINKSTLAQELGISKSRFSEILNNRMNAGLDTIGLFCIKYKFNPNWILTDSDIIKK